MQNMTAAQLIEEYTAIFNACTSLSELYDVISGIDWGKMDGLTVATITAAALTAEATLKAPAATAPMHPYYAETLDRAIAQNLYITDAMVEKSLTLREVATAFVKSYTGFNAFIHDIAVRLADRGTLSAGQMRGALNIAVSEEKQRRADVAAAQRGATARVIDTFDEDGTRAYSETIYLDIRTSTQKTLDAAGDVPTADDVPQTTKHTPNGTYTVILNAAIDEYRTIRLSDADPAVFTNLAPGTQIASFLSGSDNEGDFTGFAFVMGDTLRVWKKYKANAAASKAIKALNMLITSDDPMSAMREYVLRSSRCGVCGRKLTTPDSIRLGIGPICKGKLEAQGFEFTLTPAQRAENATRAATLIDELFPE
jgi:uncharacterized protein DUF6011